MSQSDLARVAVVRRPVPPLDSAVRADLVRLLADALVTRYRAQAGEMGATPRGPNQPRDVQASGEACG